MTSGGATLALRLGVGAAMVMVLVAVAAYAGSSVAGSFPIWLVDALLWGGLVAAAAVVLTLARRSAVGGHARDADEEQSSGRAGRVGRVVASSIPFVVLMPGLIALARSPRLQMSFHGYLHSAYAYQAIQGHLPPDNPLLAGEPANDYWLFHVLLAAISHTLRIAPPVAASIVNIAALLACLGAIAWILGRVSLFPRNFFLRSCAILFVLFGHNLFGLVHAGANGLAGETATDAAGIGTMVWSGAARSAGLFAKFLNFNGFPLGVAFFILALAGSVALTRAISMSSVVCVLTGLVGALSFHTTTGVFAVAVLPISIGGAWLITRRAPIREVSTRRVVAIACSGAALLLVIGHYVAHAATSLEESASLDLWHHANVLRFLGATYALWPLTVVGTIAALRARRSDVVLLALVALIGAICSCIAVLPDDNQYKFDYLTAIPLAIVALSAVEIVAARNGPWRSSPAVALGATAIVLTLGNQLYQGIAYLRSPMAAQQTLAYDGLNVVGEEGTPHAHAWEWIQENTASDAVVVTPIVGKNRAPVLAMSQRLIYVLDGGLFTAGNPEYVSRERAVEAIYSSTARREAKIEAFDVIRADLASRPVIVAVPLDPKIPRVTEHDFDLEPEHDLELVYDRGGTRLYRLTAG